jgi:hypothetical protein
MDLIEQYGELSFGLDFYLQAQGLGHLAQAMEGSFPPKFQRMTEELCEVCGRVGRSAGGGGFVKRAAAWFPKQ